MRARFGKALILLIFVVVAEAAMAEEALVLVAAEDSSITDLTSLEIRKLYLGFSVRDRQERQIIALTNDTDQRLTQVFLQNVMAMSQRAYTRRLLTLAVQSGRSRPEVLTSLTLLHGRLLADELAVTCMWQSDVERLGGLKILRVLWVE